MSSTSPYNPSHWTCVKSRVSNSTYSSVFFIQGFDAKHWKEYERATAANEFPVLLNVQYYLPCITVPNSPTPHLLRSTVTKQCKTSLLSAYKPQPTDTAEWPTGLSATHCIQCDKKGDSGIFGVQRHLRLVGKAKEKKITMRMMPKLICSECYSSLRVKVPSASLPPIDCVSAHHDIGYEAVTAADKAKYYNSFFDLWTEEAMSSLVNLVGEEYTSMSVETLRRGRETVKQFNEETGRVEMKFVSKEEREKWEEEEKKKEKEAKEKEKEAEKALPKDVLEALQTAPTTAPSTTANSSSACGCCGSSPSSGVTYSQCSRCHSIRYCSRDCQKKHWKDHKEECAKLTKAEKEGEQTV